MIIGSYYYLTLWLALPTAITFKLWQCQFIVVTIGGNYKLWLSQTLDITIVDNCNESTKKLECFQTKYE